MSLLLTLFLPLSTLGCTITADVTFCLDRETTSGSDAYEEFTDVTLKILTHVPMSTDFTAEII